MTDPVKTTSLAQRLTVLREAKPGTRNRDAAEELGVSEAELIASRQDAGNFRLRADWPALFAGLPKVGRVMALTRNENAVHERHGAYDAASFNGHVGLVLGPDIDLRIFLKSWTYAFAVEEEARGRTLRSLQVYDRSGMALHKIYATEATDLAAWQDLLAELKAGDDVAPLEITGLPAKTEPKDIASINAEALLAGWQGLQDTHEFQALLSKSGATPTQAFSLAEGRFTARLEVSAVRNMLEGAAAKDVPIMVFVGNRGIIQIHTGPVHRIEVMGPWLNVLDPDFNLHLREDRIAEVWRVHKPTADGIVTSIETFDAAGERIATFFGKRKPGEAELTTWQALVQSVTDPSQGAAA